MRDRRHAAAVTTIAMIFAAFGVRCGGGGGIEPTPLVPTESLSASGSASSLPPVFKPECIPTTRPANGIGPCGCPNDTPEYEPRDLAAGWHREPDLYFAEPTDPSMSDPRFDWMRAAWSAGVCPCYFDIVTDRRRRSPGTFVGDAGYLVGNTSDVPGGLTCRYERYWDDGSSPGVLACGGN